MAVGTGGTGRGKNMKRRGRGAGGNVPWGVIISGVVILSATVGVLGWLATTSDALKAKVDEAADSFQVAYWRKPIPPQGAPPETLADPARGLHPENCALCHYRQFQDWRESLHAQGMGPGVTGQFPGMSFAGQAQCLECHAPMSEQWAQLPNRAGWLDNTGFDGTLRDKGLVCSACHLRNHQRHGPPATPNRVESGGMEASVLLHGEPVRTPHFQASEFCKGCHQHPPTSLIINGKTVENTYNEWLESGYPEQGKTCQQCHMPEGRHLWRGIHDPEMTRSGVTVRTELDPAQPEAGQPLRARLILTNSGTGHAFPTYTTPAVYMRAAILDAGGNVIPGGNFEEILLQRQLDMSTSPWSESFDTRVFPGRSVTLDFARVVPEGAASVYLWVWVEPDQFYTGFYRARLQGGEDFPGREVLEKALANSLESHYALFSRTIPVRPPR